MQVLTKNEDVAGHVSDRRAAPLLGGMIGIVAAAALLLGPLPAEAARHPRHYLHHAAAAIAPGPVSASIVLDADTGRVLSESNADVQTYPASLTKMMTLYLTFEALNAGKLRLDQYFDISEAAARRIPSKMGLTAGDSIQVRDLILGIVTKSANDAATVLAEGIGGSEAAFAERMNQKARQLGMDKTFYHNASGVPDPEQRTTARDVARLALALYHDFPREYRYFSTREFDYRGEILTSHNHMLDSYPGTDGIKTGFVNASGFNIATSTVRDGCRLIGVVMGGRTSHGRDREMAGLLDQGFGEVTGDGESLIARHEAPPAAQPSHPATVAEAAPPPAPPGVLAKAKLALFRHLSPVAKAEAATLPREIHPALAASGEHWSIQLGAFHGETAAQKVAHAAESVPIIRGKPLQITQPAKADKDHLYRARLLNFTPKGAQDACAALHKKKIECSVIPPAGLRVANR